MSKATEFDKTLAVIQDIASEVVAERINQVDMWGVQDWGSVHSENMRRSFEVQADRWKQINDARLNDGALAWDGILLEEVYEALSEVDPLLRRMELVQVAAVAAAEIEAIDRRIAEGEYGYAELALEVAE